jgi:hypothetical protein
MTAAAPAPDPMTAAAVLERLQHVERVAAEAHDLVQQLQADLLSSERWRFTRLTLGFDHVERTLGDARYSAGREARELAAVIEEP